MNVPVVKTDLSKSLNGNPVQESAKDMIEAINNIIATLKIQGKKGNPNATFLLRRL